MLFRAGDNTWAGLTDVGFRVGRFGQLAFTLEGEDYYVQYLPVGMQELVCPPELMLAQMNVAGVDHCILQAGGGYGAMNDYNAFAQQPVPRQIHRACCTSTRRRPTAARRWRKSIARSTSLGLARALLRAGFLATRLRAATSTTRISGRSGTRSSLRELPVFIELSSTPTYDRAGYLQNLAALDALLTRYPAHRFLLVMGPPVGLFRDVRRSGNFRTRSPPLTSATTCCSK